jgi:hypothetical protein
MEWKDVGEFVGKVAPAVGTVLGGPAAAVGGAIGLLAKAFGLDQDADPGQVMAAINADPEAIIKLKALDIEMQRIYLLDRQSARTADVDKTKATGKRDTNLYVLSWVVVSGFFLLIGCLIFHQIPDTNELAKVALPMLFGALISGFKDVLGYFFGSSKSSAEKTEMLRPK